MITNLVGSIIVSIVTNTTERLPQRMEPAPCNHSMPAGMGCTLGHFRYVTDANPTNKWVRTTVKRVTTLKFDWLGAREVASEEVLSDVEVELALNQNWNPVGTNSVAGKDFYSGRWYALTNLIHFGNTNILTNAWFPK